MTRLWGCWQRVWDFEAPRQTYVRLRVALGAMWVVVFLSLIPNAPLLYDAERGLSPTRMRATLGGVHLDYFDRLTGPEVYAAIALGVIASVLYAAGIVPLVMGLLIYVIHLGFQYRCYTWMDGSDDLIRALLFCLLWVPWWRKGDRLPGWPLRLWQGQVAVMYLATAIWKSQGADWTNGSALYWILSDPRWTRFPTELLVGTSAGQLFLRLSTWGTLVLEYALPVLLFWPRTRRGAILVGVALHLGIWLSMRVGLFTPVVLMSYLAFWDGDLPGARWYRRRKGLIGVG